MVPRTSLFCPKTISLFLIALHLPASLAQDGTSIDHVQFADSLTTALYANGNECTSSWGVSMAFSLVYPSSTGASEEQIRTVLGYPTGSKQRLVWNETSTRIDQSYEGVCITESQRGCNLEGPTVEIANSVWIDNDMTLNSEYEQVVGGYLRQIDFADRGAGGIINDWVDGATNGLIDSIVDEGPIRAGNILIAVNSIYLKASWNHQFSDQQTSQDLFYNSASRSDVSPTTEARFMHQIEFFPYSHDALSGFQIVKLDFSSEDESPLSMLFVLPLSEASGLATSSDVLGAIPALSDTRVALAIPKFRFESSYEDSLKSALGSIGITTPFEEGFCIQSQSDCRASISSIIQKTVIDVNENGVEAAAVTAMMMRATAIVQLSPEVVPFVADHPFQFFIYDEAEDLVLFEGRVGNPGIGEDEPSVAALTAKHSDETFWEDNYRVELIGLPRQTSDQDSNPDQDITPGQVTDEIIDPNSSSAFSFEKSMLLSTVLCAVVSILAM